MKMRKYEDIKPSNRTNFVMVYYHAGRTLTQIETLLKKSYGNPLPIRPRGGHFTALEQPKEFAEDIKNFVAKLK